MKGKIDFNSKWIDKSNNESVRLILTDGTCQLIIENEMEVINETFQKHGHYFGRSPNDWYVFDKFTKELCIQLKYHNENNMFLSLNDDERVLKHDKIYKLVKVIDFE